MCAFTQTWLARDLPKEPLNTVWLKTQQLGQSAAFSLPKKPSRHVDSHFRHTKLARVSGPGHRLRRAPPPSFGRLRAERRTLEARRGWRTSSSVCSTGPTGPRRGFWQRLARQWRGFGAPVARFRRGFRAESAVSRVDG